MKSKESKKRRRRIRAAFLLLLFAAEICVGCASGTRESSGEHTATVSIRCDTAVANGMQEQEKWQDIIPEDGCILPETQMAFDEGDTVFDLLCDVRDTYRMQMEYSGAGGNEYIEGIQNLYEFDGGRWSGWMYSVNGEYPNCGCGQYKLQDGDVVEWQYTCDLGLDLEAGMTGAQEWKDTHD